MQCKCSHGNTGISRLKVRIPQSSLYVNKVDMCHPASLSATGDLSDNLLIHVYLEIGFGEVIKRRFWCYRHVDQLEQFPNRAWSTECSLEGLKTPVLCYQ